MAMESQWVWEIATEAGIVHSLLEESDRLSATSAAPAPRRNPARTQALVESGDVQLLQIKGRPAAAISLTAAPPFDIGDITFTPSECPAYMQRLTVAGWALAHFGAMVGLSAVRRAMEIARERGADVLRCEINPDLHEVAKLLSSLGFRMVARREGVPARAYLELRLVPDRLCEAVSCEGGG